ncbi:MAG: c-type cytochrome [Planctomycetes bacterium]|nr:c-type cytochrome [Planctomycetota bacterium]
MTRLLFIALVALITATARAEEALDYAAVDPELKVVKLDSSETESFLSVRADMLGRLFVGAREALFVCEPLPGGGYAPRQELYRFPADTWVNDIAIRGHDVYVSTVAAIYVLRDAVVKREGLKPERLLWGVPLGHVHQCFHGLAWGPEGALYVSMGDPVWYYGDFNRPDHWGHWSFFTVPTGADGEKTVEVNGRRWARTPYNGVGGVFRIQPDGSRFEVVAGGLRNSCGLAFDHEWNLFTNDNDHESMPAQYVPGRLLHIVEHAYYGWPRGWLRSKTPERADLLDTLNEKLGRFVPVALSYYDETFLPEKYRNNLLVARWCIKSVTRYPLVPSGATFKADEFHLLDGRDQARPVGVCVGRGGRIFATICYMAQNEGSPVYRSDLVMITRADDPPSAPFEAYDPVTATPEKLISEWKDSSWQRRYAAYVEIARRGRDPHAKNADLKKLPRLVTAWAKSGSTIGRISSFPIYDDATLSDSFRRNAICRELAQGNTYKYIERLVEQRDGSALARLAGVLAAGFRLTLPDFTGELAPDLKLDKLQNESAYKVQYADETIDLRTLGPVGVYTVADHWHQGKHTAEQEQLFALLLKAAGDEDEQVRLQAVHFLSLLNDPRSEPTVEKVLAANDERKLGIAKLAGITEVWLAGPFDDGDEGFAREHEPERGPVELSTVYHSKSRDIKWQRTKTKRQFDFVELFGPVDRASMYAYFRIESGGRQRAHLALGSDDGLKVWHNGQVVWTNDVIRGALPLQDTVTVELQPGSNDFLLRVRNVIGSSQLYINYRSLQPLAVVLPELVTGPSLAERLASAANGQYKIPAEFLTIDWPKEVAGGDAEQGRKLFETAGCAKCHAVTAESQVTGGPSLADAARRFTVPYLVESVLAPNKQISPVFRATQVITTDGRQLSGLLVAETADKVELLLPDTKRVAINKSEIEERALQNLSPMPQGIVKQPSELRDILAYLLRGK